MILLEFFGEVPDLTLKIGTDILALSLGSSYLTVLSFRDIILTSNGLTSKEI
jgi:hypothetical protein